MANLVMKSRKKIGLELYIVHLCKENEELIASFSWCDFKLWKLYLVSPHDEVNNNDL